MGADGVPPAFFIGMAIFALSGFGQVAMCMFVGSKQAGANEMAINEMKKTVEIELNEQWQKPLNVRWSVTTEQTLETTGSRDNRRIRTRTWHNIQVTSLTVQAPVQQVIVRQVPMQQVAVL